VSVEAEVEAVVRGSGTNITATDSSRLNLDQHVVVADWRNGLIPNLYGHRPQENARPIRRRDIYSHRFLGGVFRVAVRKSLPAEDGELKFLALISPF